MVFWIASVAGLAIAYLFGSTPTGIESRTENGIANLVRALWDCRDRGLLVAQMRSPARSAALQRRYRIKSGRDSDVVKPSRLTQAV